MTLVGVDTVKKEFSWSYSKLKAYDDCPRRFNETYLQKDKWPEQRSEQLDWGDAVHKALAKALRTGEPLPTVFQLYQSWVDWIAGFGGERLIEDDCRWAITREFKPTPWFAKNVWLRCIADVVVLQPPVAIVIDWKAGKSSNVDPMQLTLTSLMMFLQFPKLKLVRSDFVWLQEDHQTTQSLRRSECPDAWAELMPRVNRLEKAYRDNKFPPMPGRFCKKWCPVQSCEFWGK